MVAAVYLLLDSRSPQAALAARLQRAHYRQAGKPIYCKANLNGRLAFSRYFLDDLRLM